MIIRYLLREHSGQRPVLYVVLGLKQKDVYKTARVTLNRKNHSVIKVNILKGIVFDYDW